MNQADSTVTVLVVEDDAPLREALCDTLASAGHRALAAGNGREALAMLASEPVALVVSDVQMEGLDGHELLRSIKSRWPELPIHLIWR